MTTCQLYVCSVTYQEVNFIRNSLRSLFQALGIIINRMEYVICV